MPRLPGGRQRERQVLSWVCGPWGLGPRMGLPPSWGLRGSDRVPTGNGPSASSLRVSVRTEAPHTRAGPGACALSVGGPARPACLLCVCWRGAWAWLWSGFRMCAVQMFRELPEELLM